MPAAVSDTALVLIRTVVVFPLLRWQHQPSRKPLLFVRGLTIARFLSTFILDSYEEFAEAPMGEACQWPGTVPPVLIAAK